MSIDNPFYHRGAIRQAEHFHGRTAVSTQILELLHNGQSVSLVGPRRIGKSSLLLHLQRQTIAKANAPLFMLLDCQEVGGSPAERVYEALLCGLREAAQDAGITLDEEDSIGTYRALDRTLRQLYRQNIAVVILLDEFELLAGNDELSPYFFARLRGLTTKYGLAYLTASQRPLYAITAQEEILSSPFFNIFVTVPLGTFSADEAESLLQTRTAASQYHFSPALTNYLLELVGAHPFFLHIAGYHAYQSLSHGAMDDLFTSLNSPIEAEASSHLHYLWQNLTADEQHALIIADGNVDSVRHLQQQCLLIPNKNDGDMRFQYSSRMLRDFVRRQHVDGLIQAGPFVIDEQRHQVWGGLQMQLQLVNLTTSQFNLLLCLCQRDGQVVHGDVLETAVWGNPVSDPDRLKTLIKRLRRAVTPHHKWIVSERGVGYALRAAASNK